MPVIQLEALDTLFFRDGKPFTMGEDNYVSSSKLPYPSVFWGSLFSSLLFSGKVTTADKSKLSINAIYLYNETTKDILLPAPADLFVDKKGKVAFDTTEQYQLIENPHYKGNKVMTNDMQGIVMIDAEWIEQPTDNYILASAFSSSYSNMQLLHTIDMLENDFVKSNNKIGIGRNKEMRVAEEGMLYRINMQEYGREWSFLIDYELTDVEMPSNGILRLGGEGKMATFKVLDKTPYAIQELNNTQNTIRKELINKEFFKIVFGSPLVYNGREAITQIFTHEDITLVSAVMGKPISIGGFDVEKQQPKPMIKGLAAGCVFICHKPKNVDLVSFEKHLNEKLKDYKKQGFNQFHFTHYTQ